MAATCSTPWRMEEGAVLTNSSCGASHSSASTQSKPSSRKGTGPSGPMRSNSCLRGVGGVQRSSTRVDSESSIAARHDGRRRGVASELCVLVAAMVVLRRSSRSSKTDCTAKLISSRAVLQARLIRLESQSGTTEPAGHVSGSAAVRVKGGGSSALIRAVRLARWRRGEQGSGGRGTGCDAPWASEVAPACVGSAFDARGGVSHDAMIASRKERRTAGRLLWP